MIYDKNGSKEEILYLFKKIEKHYEFNVTNNKPNLLNAGCGSNRIKKYLEKKYNVIGLDINNPQADIQADLSKPLSIEDNSFDIVILNHVIEHIQYPYDLLLELYRILRKGGILFISTPSPWSESAWDDPYHFRPYTLNSLSMLGKDSGFDIVESFYSIKTPLFGLLKLTRFAKFKLFCTYKLKFLLVFNYFKANSNIILKK